MDYRGTRLTKLSVETSIKTFCRDVGVSKDEALKMLKTAAISRDKDTREMAREVLKKVTV